MKKILMMLLTLMMSFQTAQAMNVDEFIDKNIAPFTDFIAKIIFAPIPIMGTVHWDADILSLPKS